jgi:type IV pilus assembly protein PilN
MIKINLAAKKRFTNAVAAPAEGGDTAAAGGKFSFDRLGITRDDLKDLPLKMVAFCIVAGIIANTAADKVKTVRLTEAEAKVEAIRLKQGQLTAEISKMKSFDEQRKSLENTEATLKGKIEAIKKLLADRLGMYNIMYAVSSSVPNQVWLTGLEVKSDTVTMRGSSLDINEVSDLMKRINETPYFKDLTLKKTDQVRDAKGNEIANFELVSGRR